MFFRGFFAQAETPSRAASFPHNSLIFAPIHLFQFSKHWIKIRTLYSVVRLSFSSPSQVQTLSALKQQPYFCLVLDQVLDKAGRLFPPFISISVERTFGIKLYVSSHEINCPIVCCVSSFHSWGSVRHSRSNLDKKANFTMVVHFNLFFYFYTPADAAMLHSQ